MEDADYFNNPFWKIIRQKRLRIDNFRCYYCGRPATEVHHLKYNPCGLDRIYNLRSICKECHKLWHEEFETLPGEHSEENFLKFLELKYSGLSFREIKIYFVNLYRKNYA
jgi:hypothetical protein